MAGSSGIGFIYPKPMAGGVDERLTVSSSATPFASLSTWKGLPAKLIKIDVQTDDVMVTFDGSTPTASNGHRLYAGFHDIWSMETAAAASFIRVTTDAVVHASPFTY